MLGNSSVWVFFLCVCKGLSCLFQKKIQCMLPPCMHPIPSSSQLFHITSSTVHSMGHHSSKKDVKQLESVQRKSTEMVLEDKVYEQ